MDFRAESLRILEKCEEAVLTSVSPQGFPRACYLSIIGHKNFNKIYFSTGVSGTKVSHFRQNNKASVCYRLGADSVTLSGTVKIITDRSVKEKMWQDWMINYFADGVDDKEYCLLEFTGTEATYWIDHKYLRDDKIED